MTGAKIVAIANQKGGVGKTTTTMNLGAAIAKAGKRVLLIDCDPQANLTSYLGVTPGTAPYEGLSTVDEVFLAKRPLDDSSRTRFIATTRSGVDLVASDQNLTGIEYYLFSRTDKELVLSHFLNGLRSRYDYILIDTPPSLSLLTLNALCASDRVLVPVQPEFFGLEGIVKIRAAIEMVRERWNAGIAIVGVLPTQVSERRKLTTEVLDALKAELGPLLFDTQIHDNAAVTESSGQGTSVIEYRKSSRGAEEYTEAAMELMLRLSRGDEADADVPPPPADPVIEGQNA